MDINYIDCKPLRNKIRYLIFKEQVTKVYVLEDLTVFGFKEKGLETENAISTTSEQCFTEEEIRAIYNYPGYEHAKVIDLHFTDISVNYIHIPQSMYDNEYSYNTIEKEIMHRIEFEMEDSEIYYCPEMHLSTFDVEELRMSHAIWAPDKI